MLNAFDPTMRIPCGLTQIPSILCRGSHVIVRCKRAIRPTDAQRDVIDSGRYKRIAFGWHVHSPAKRGVIIEAFGRSIESLHDECCVLETEPFCFNDRSGTAM